MATSSNPSEPENPTNNHLHPLQCPRCNSANTKFCYYNNYSLSQPRHFCKACKRYWTRGGTLRNVPVGGGCRKNKRQKRPASTASPKADPPIPSNPNPFYANSEQHEFPFSGFRSTRVCGGFDFQPQINGLGLGFPSGLTVNPNHEPVNKSQPFSTGHESVFYGSSSSTMASLLASTFPKFGANVGPGLMSYEEMGKELKLEGDQNGLGWSTDPNPSYYPDPYSLLGAWFDPSNSNMGSSVPSLI